MVEATPRVSAMAVRHCRMPDVNLQAKLMPRGAAMDCSGIEGDPPGGLITRQPIGVSGLSAAVRKRLLLYQRTAEPDVVIPCVWCCDVAETDRQPVFERAPGAATCDRCGTPFPNVAAHVVKTELVGSEAAD